MGTAGGLWKSDWHRRIARTQADKGPLIEFAIASPPGVGVGIVLLDLSNGDTVGLGDAITGIRALDDIAVTHTITACLGREDRGGHRSGQKKPPQGEKVEVGHLKDPHMPYRVNPLETWPALTAGV